MEDFGRRAEPWLAYAKAPGCHSCAAGRLDAKTACSLKSPLKVRGIKGVISTVFIFFVSC
ncbi:MAG: hypothetical protein HXY36_00935 [Chloroflexi bacterium]|nr:hypothetical protein [Chloroflexota bacterium]